MPIIAVIFLVISTMTTLIFSAPKAIHLKFLYPGFVTFFLFMVLPIIFTIYIGFTNLSTGHLLSKSEVFNILLEEKNILKDESPYTFYLYKSDNKIYIEVTDFNSKPLFATISEKGSEHKIELTYQTPTLKKRLSLSEVYKLKILLKSKLFILPNQKIISYFRVDKLITLSNRFSSPDGINLLEIKSGRTYHSNDELGFFEYKGAYLAPGYYTNVGLKNFSSLINNEQIKGPFLKVLIWTFIWALLSVILSFSLGLLIALILNQKKMKFKLLYRLLFVIPYSIPFFISVLVFRGLLNKDFGIINELLSYIQVSPIPWLEDPIWAKVSVLLVNLWLGFPYMLLIITGILQSIPESIYEAAAIDGASPIQKLRHLTLPLVMNSIGPLLVGTFAFNLNNFVGIYLLTGGLPPMQGTSTPVGETDILISYTYRLAFEGGAGQNFGLASSIAIFIFIIIAILTLINFRLTGVIGKKDSHE